MAAMVCVAGFVRSLDRLQVRVRTVAVTCGICVAAMLALYLAAGRPDPVFGSTGDPHLASRLYSVVYLTYMITWLGRLMRTLWAAGRREEWPLNIGACLASLRH